MFNPLRNLLHAQTSDAVVVRTRHTPRACDAALTGTTRKWLRRLPAGRRPLRLCELYPRVANRIAWCWADESLRDQTLADLLEDRRGGRRGFPGSVARELQRLRELEGPLADCPARGAWWRAMVKGLGN